MLRRVSVQQDGSVWQLVHAYISAAEINGRTENLPQGCPRDEGKDATFREKDSGRKIVFL